MLTKIYNCIDSAETIITKSYSFLQSIFDDNPSLETIFVPTTKGFEVMISKEDGKLTGYWNSDNGNEDYADLKDFLEIHQIKEYQSVSEIIDSGY